MSTQPRERRQQIIIRVDAHQAEQLRELARESDRPVAYVARRLIAAGLRSDPEGSRE